ncbi:MAG: tyrosine-type recombinase/integrase [Solirubrobacterales bacterium]
MAEERLRVILDGRDPEVEVEPVAEAGPTFSQIAREHVAFVRDDRKRRKSTVADYSRSVEKVLIPEFGEDTPADSIDTDRIEGWRESMVEAGKLKPRTINKYLAHVHAIYKLAGRRHGIRPNPVADAERQPHRPSGEFKVLEPSEVRLLAVNAVTDQDGALFTVAAFSGLRLGELRGLRWADIRWTEGLIYVRTSHVRHEDGLPKSGRVRSVPLTDQAAAALEALSRREHFTGDRDRVFVNDVGGPVEESALRRRFYTALDDAGLPRMRLHDLRHTFGTLAVRAFPLPSVQAMMGHADPQTTALYTHHVPRHDDAQRLTKLLAASMEESAGSTVGPQSGEDGGGGPSESEAQSQEPDAGGGTRTPDTRIMILVQGLRGFAADRSFPL